MERGKASIFEEWASVLNGLEDFSFAPIEESFRQLATAKGGIKPGELRLPFRIMLCGGKFGPPVFTIAETDRQSGNGVNASGWRWLLFQ